MKYSSSLTKEAKRLRSKGYTYSEINNKLSIKIPKGTLNYWFKNISLHREYYKKVENLNNENIKKARLLALDTNRAKREVYLKGLDEVNLGIAKLIKNNSTAKIALSMLCLGEASKYKSSKSFSLGSSDPRIIKIFLVLLKQCFKFDVKKVRCSVQCRADQNVKELEKYWMETTRIPRRLFYKAQIDPRTVGKPTKKENYKGVLRVYYLDTRVHLELESLANLVYNHLK